VFDTLAFAHVKKYKLKAWAERSSLFGDIERVFWHWITSFRGVKQWCIKWR